MFALGENGNILPETLKYWVGVQRGQSYLLGRTWLFSLGWPTFSLWCCNKNTLWGGCFYCINQPVTPSFCIGLAKTESGFIVRSVETGLGKWMLVVAMISVDAYPFLAFSDLNCLLDDTRIGVFWCCTVLPVKTKFGSSNQEASPSAGKNAGVFLVVWIFLIWQMSSHWETQKLLQGFMCHECTDYFPVFNLFLTQWINHYQKDVNQITLNHTTF